MNPEGTAQRNIAAFTTAGIMWVLVPLVATVFPTYMLILNGLLCLVAAAFAHHYRVTKPRTERLKPIILAHLHEKTFCDMEAIRARIIAQGENPSCTVQALAALEYSGLIDGKWQEYDIDGVAATARVHVYYLTDKGRTYADELAQGQREQPISIK